MTDTCRNGFLVLTHIASDQIHVTTNHPGAEGEDLVSTLSKHHTPRRAPPHKDAEDHAARLAAKVVNSAGFFPSPLLALMLISWWLLRTCEISDLGMACNLAAADTGLHAGREVGSRRANSLPHMGSLEDVCENRKGEKSVLDYHVKWNCRWVNLQNWS